MSRLEQRVDLLTEALLQISSELWSTRDRLMTLEEVLAKAGMDVPTLVNNHEPSPELETRLKNERERFISRLMETLSGAEK